MIDALNKMYGKIADKITPDIILYILFGLVGLVFIVSLIVALSNKERRMFKRGAKTVAAGGHADEMPPSVARAFRRAQTLGRSPADFLSLEGCVTAPYRASAMSRLGRINFCATLFIAFFGAMLCAAAEARLYGAVIESWAEWQTVYMGLPILLAGGGLLSLIAAIIGAASYRSSVKAYNSMMEKLNAEYMTATPAATPAETAPAAPAPAFEPDTHVTFRPAATPAETEARAAAMPEEDVVARIDRISREGAPVSVMREVALLLQQERAKPENKTPEQQRRLNEALSKLLKAMSNR